MGNIQGYSQSPVTYKELKRARRRFLKINEKGSSEINREDFGVALGLVGNPCAERLFKIIDKDESGTLSFEEICDYIATVRSMNSRDAKLHVLFKFYDKNGDGKISREEISDAMLLACAEPLARIGLDELVESTINTFDLDKDDGLSYDEFSNLMKTAGIE
ncbi:hypothetical protein O6H91_01G162900 [Diphasiastrum complanatum]|uniref:Uncharacterized protein n=1 Tax=Diphasiastrum complanatum TaxID=34168 RepID=A0ACC2EYC9_DIPCM|nr:hypothetical protein O6H91_01G162900 [Diphasiastrum complanatum]